MHALIAALAIAAAGVSPIRIDQGSFVDPQGRVAVLRGVNVSGDAKTPPFMPIHRPELLDPLPKLGFNVIRLLFVWEAYEPERGQYNEAYLDYIVQVSRWAHERDMLTLVDFHEDALSRYMNRGCGDGFPEWAIAPQITRAVPDNGGGCDKWFAYQWIDGSMRTAWSAFYRDENGVRASYIAMAKRVASRLAREPGVIGYDLINEPAGHEIADMSALYEDMAPELQEVHPGALMLLEPHAKVVLGLQSGLPNPSFPNAVYAPHFYDGFTRVINTYPGYGLRHAFGNMEAKAASWGAPLFLGEFGIPPTVRNALSYMRTNYDRLDETFASSTQWGYSPGWTDEAKDGWNREDFNIIASDGQPRANFRPRPYAQRIAGRPIHLHVHDADDLAERSAELQWEHDPERGETQIYVPLEHFFRGLPAVVADGVQCRWSGTKLLCSSLRGGSKRVTLAPADSSDL